MIARKDIKAGDAVYSSQLFPFIVGQVVRVTSPVTNADGSIAVQSGAIGIIQLIRGSSTCANGEYIIQLEAAGMKAIVTGDQIELLPAIPRTVPVVPLSIPDDMPALTFEQAFADAMTEYDLAAEKVRNFLVEKPFVQPSGDFRRAVEDRDEAAARVWPLKAVWHESEERRRTLAEQVRNAISPPPQDGSDDDIPF